MELSKLLKFITLNNQFQHIVRRVRVKDEERYENDVEHSFQLAFSAWYIIDSNRLPLNKDLAIQYGLVHDLVEVFAGDTYIYDPDPAVHASKQAREHAAALRLREEYPEFTQLHDLIQQYEARQDMESKFIYALDKLLPMINIYLDHGRTWQQETVDLQMLIDNKKSKVGESSEINEIFDAFIELLKSKELELFGKVTTK